MRRGRGASPIVILRDVDVALLPELLDLIAAAGLSCLGVELRLARDDGKANPIRLSYIHRSD